MGASYCIKIIAAILEWMAADRGLLFESNLTTATDDFAARAASQLPDPVIAGVSFLEEPDEQLQLFSVEGEDGLYTNDSLEPTQLFVSVPQRLCKQARFNFVEALELPFHTEGLVVKRDGVKGQQFWYDSAEKQKTR